MYRLFIIRHFLLALLVFQLMSCVKPVDNSTDPEVDQSSLEPLTSEEKSYYLEKGKEISQHSFEALSSALKGAMSRGGVEEAITYCNVSVMPLTDSLSKAYNATIKRAALRYRNPVNKPTEEEEQALNAYLTQSSEYLEMDPEVSLLDNNHIAFYAPITTKGLCLTCHGVVGETLAEDQYEVIKALYPDDQATGFAMGDLRGIWSITFERAPDTPRHVGIIKVDSKTYLTEITKYSNPIQIDVRTPSEYATGHIEGTMNIDVKSADFVNQIESLDKDAVYFVNCKSGIRSSRACKIMEKNGFKYIYNLDGGLLSWREEGHPIVE